MSLPSIETIAQALSEHPPCLDTEIAPDDPIFDGNHNYYLRVGKSALYVIYLAMLAAGKYELKTILDLPSGHGRVMRWLRAAFPDAELTACDLDTKAVDYCASTFGAQLVYSRENLEHVVLPTRYDLIWCGSLLTHLGEQGWTQCLNLCIKSLAPNGLFLFTTHGHWVAERIRNGTASYGLAVESLAPLFAGYDQSGFGFQEYPGQTAYGISISKPSWVCARLEHLSGLKIVCFQERGWLRHQDVFACVSSESSLPHL